jgi:hypothetical protein
MHKTAPHTVYLSLIYIIMILTPVAGLHAIATVTLDMDGCIDSDKKESG